MMVTVGLRAILSFRVEISAEIPAAPASDK
jgi:hypothetical protein